MPSSSIYSRTVVRFEPSHISDDEDDNQDTVQIRIRRRPPPPSSLEKAIKKLLEEIETLRLELRLAMHGHAERYRLIIDIDGITGAPRKKEKKETLAEKIASLEKKVEELTDLFLRSSRLHSGLAGLLE